MRYLRPLRAVQYGDRPTLPADIALCAAIVRLAMRDALSDSDSDSECASEAQEFLDIFLDGAPPDLITAYRAGEVNLQYVCPWDRPELLGSKSKKAHDQHA